MSEIRPEQIPTTLMQPAMDAGHPPDGVSEQTGGSVTYGPGTLVCTAPPNAAMRVSFFDEGACYIDGESVAVGETRIIKPRGASFTVKIVPAMQVPGFPVQIHQDWPEGCRCVIMGGVRTALGDGPCPLHDGEWPV
jgi:hypothetical protein